MGSQYVLIVWVEQGGNVIDGVLHAPQISRNGTTALDVVSYHTRTV